MAWFIILRHLDEKSLQRKLLGGCSPCTVCPRFAFNGGMCLASPVLLGLCKVGVQQPHVTSCLTQD